MSKRNYIQRNTDNGDNEMKRLFSIANGEIVNLELQMEAIKKELTNTRNEYLINAKCEPFIKKIEALKDAKLTYVFSLFANGCVVE